MIDYYFNIILLIKYATNAIIWIIVLSSTLLSTSQLKSEYHKNGI